MNPIDRSPSPCRRAGALTNCPDCGREVSTRAPHCVNCGRPYPAGRRCAGFVLVHVAILAAVVAAGVAIHKTRPHAFRCDIAQSVQPCGHLNDWNQALELRVRGTGYLGIQLDDDTSIDVVGRGSPAETVGLESGDRIVRIGGASMTCIHDVLQAIWSHKVGDRVEVVVRRDGEQKIFNATLAKHPRD